MNHFRNLRADILTCTFCNQDYNVLFDVHIDIAISPTYQTVQNGLKKLFSEIKEKSSARRVKC